MTGFSLVKDQRTRAIVSATVRFAALSLLPKLLSVVKDMAVAARFGASRTLDSYLVAFVLIGIPVAVISIALQTALTPALVGRDREGAARLLGGAIKLALGLLALILPLWLLALPRVCAVLYPRLPPGAIDELVTACLWLTPYYFMNGANHLFYGALQARREFWPNALLPALFPLAILVCLLVSKAAVIGVLVAGTVAGSAGECAALLLLVRRAGWLRLRNTANAGLLRIVRLALPLAAGGIVTAFSLVIEQLLAFRLGEGAVSLLNYGFKVPTALASLLVTGLAIVVLPHFAELMTAGAWRASKALHRRVSAIALGLGLGIAAGVSVAAETVVRLLFERGAFTSRDTMAVAEVMRVYLVQLPFLMAGAVSARVLIALGRTGTMTGIVVVQLALAGALAYALSERFGVAGVAAGTTGATLLGAILFGGAAWAALAARTTETEAS
jgi:putative peptidoglycan lipid II flippase